MIKKILTTDEVLNTIVLDVNNKNEFLELNDSTKEAFLAGYKDFKESLKSTINNIDRFVKASKDKLKLAGLLKGTGQLSFKMHILDKLKNDSTKTKESLDELLEILSILTSSLGNAISEIGSYISEFIDMIKFLLSTKNSSI